MKSLVVARLFLLSFLELAVVGCGMIEMQTPSVSPAPSASVATTDGTLDNEFWKPIKAYWKDPASQEKRDSIRHLVSYEATKWQYLEGVPNPELVSPDGAAHDQFLLDRTGNDEIQLDLFLSYGSNPPLYPQWQEYFRTHQPPMLIAWGRNDKIFPPAGAEPYKRDLKTLEFHLLDAGHFALETSGDEIARLMRAFLGRHARK